MPADSPRGMIILLTMTHCNSRRTCRIRDWAGRVRGRRAEPAAVIAWDGAAAELAIPTLVCFKGGLRPGDEVEFYVRDSDTGGEIVIRRRA